MNTVGSLTEDTEIALTHGQWKLTVSPYGASLRGLSRVDRNGASFDVVTPYHGAKAKAGGQGDVLIPFPGRIAGGVYTFDGATYHLEKTDHEGPNAIHGFLRHKMWDADVRDASVVFSTEIAADDYVGYPFALSVTLTYALSDSGLTSTFAITNTGDDVAPVAAGFHPYFTVGPDLIDSDTLQVDFDAFIEFKSDLLPTGNVLPVEGSSYDFLHAKTIGGVVFNTCYAGPVQDDSGVARIRLASASADRYISVWLDNAFGYVVLYSGDPLPDSHRRRSLAIEPMTCATDAFNRPEWGLIDLAPGATTTGTWGVEAG